MEWLNRTRNGWRVSVIIVMIMTALTANGQTISDAAKELKSQINEMADSIDIDKIAIDSLLVDSMENQSKFRKFLRNLGGMSIAADVFNPLMMVISDYGQIEGALKIGIKGTYYPTLEIGLGKCDMTDDNTDITYKATAPFFRIGLDYNILSNKKQRNKFFVGARYGFTSFNYDMSGPVLHDPVFGGAESYSYTGQTSTCQWLEFVIGLQAQIWHGFHMGWSVRYKSQIKVGENPCGKPYYIPGYGTTTNSSCWGASYNLIWDIKL